MAKPYCCAITRGSCPACGLYSIRWQESLSPEFERCNNCGVMLRCEVPTAAELRRRYSEMYYGEFAQLDCTGFESEMGMLLGLGNFLKTYYLRSDDRVLDFGAGTGRFAGILRTFGVATDGVELAEEARREASRRYGFDFKADLSELSGASYDWITAVEVVDHLPDPENVLNQLWELLKPGGGLFLTTPNANGLAARLYAERWRETTNPFHLILFTYSALKALLMRTRYDRVKPIMFSPIGDVSLLRAALHRELQLLRLYGGLRIVAHKPRV